MVLSDKRFSPSTSCAHNNDAATELSNVEVEDNVSSTSDLSDSPSQLSNTRSGDGEAAPTSNFSSAALGPSLRFYYSRTAKAPASSRSEKGKSATDSPVPLRQPAGVAAAAAGTPATEHAAPSVRAAARPSSTQVRPRQPSSPTPVPDASGLRSTASSVFDRLADDATCGTTTLGKRVLQWARGAGLVLQPSRAAWNALHLRATAPQRHERLWRRTCAKARHRLSLFARRKLGVGAEGAATSAAGSCERPGTRPTTYADPRRNGAADPAGRGGSAHGRAGRRPSSSPLSTPGGLRAYRCREEYKRWCYWQLCHFYEMGSKYLTSVWRRSPLVCRGPHHRGAAGGTLGVSDMSATAVLANIFDGRYIVPSVTSINEALAALKEQDRRAKVLLRLLMRENASPAPLTDEKFDSSSAGLADQEGPQNSVTDGEDDAKTDEGDEEDQGDVYHSVNESRRSSEAVAATEPFFDVRLDDATGLLHLSLYANGDESGDGADFVGSCVAACVDNHRWVILKGLWAREVLVFHFHRPSLDEVDVSSPGKTTGAAAVAATATAPHDAPDDSSASAFDEEVEQRVSRHSQHVDGFVLNGVAFTKVQMEHVSASAQDTFVCSRCGHLRSRHNDAYISKRTGRLVRGYYYCVLCHRCTHHVRLPPMETLADHVEEVFAASVEQSTRQIYITSTPTGTPMSRTSVLAASTPPGSTAWLYRSADILPSATPSRKLPQRQQPFTTADVTLTAKAMCEWTRAAAAAPRPAWRFGLKASSDELFGRPRGLDHPPPHPHY